MLWLISSKNWRSSIEVPGLLSFFVWEKTSFPIPSLKHPWLNSLKAGCAVSENFSSIVNMCSHFLSTGVWSWWIWVLKTFAWLGSWGSKHIFPITDQPSSNFSPQGPLGGPWTVSKTLWRRGMSRPIRSPTSTSGSIFGINSSKGARWGWYLKTLGSGISSRSSGIQLHSNNGGSFWIKVPSIDSTVIPCTLLPRAVLVPVQVFRAYGRGSPFTSSFSHNWGEIKDTLEATSIVA